MKPKKLFYILLIVWLFVDFLQAVLTPIHPDEAYYALYGANLAFGYFDHPPMVAVLTFLSNLLFNGNLSARFFTVVIHTATIWILGITISDKLNSTRSVLTFFAICASMPVFVIYGFITTPDAPLLFFTALFFFFYKKYLQNHNLKYAIILGIVFAAMLYSKYMAVLVIAFVILSNLKLLKDYKFYLAGVLSLFLFLPHILWQINNNFPSLQYHLIQRNTPFKIGDLFLFPLNQLLIFNPVCLIFAIFCCIKNRKTENLFERACIFTVSGFILFFWAMTFKGRGESHWTAAASIPMIILLFDKFVDNNRQKYVKYFIIPIAVFLIAARCFTPILSLEKFNILPKRDIFDEIQAKSDGNPTVFVSSFQNPSLYWFYFGEKTTALSSIYNRKTQFDIWRFDADFQGLPINIVGNASYGNISAGENAIITNDGQYYILKVSDFQSANRITVSVNDYQIISDSIKLDLSLYNPYSKTFNFNHPELPVTLMVAYIDNNDTRTISTDVKDSIIIPSQDSVTLSVTVPYYPDIPMAVCLDNVVCRSVNSSGFNPKNTKR